MLCWESLDELQKVKQISVSERQRLPRIYVKSVTLQFIDAHNAIIDLVKGKLYMRKLIYLVYIAGLVVNQLSNTEMKTKTKYGYSCTSSGQNFYCGKLAGLIVHSFVT